MLLMLVGIGFISILTATIASLFVKTDRENEHTSIACRVVVDRGRSGGGQGASRPGLGLFDCEARQKVQGARRRVIRRARGVVCRQQIGAVLAGVHDGGASVLALSPGGAPVARGR